MRRLAPVFTLFFLAPLIAEFFLGDFPIVLLPLIVALAPMYGGGALLIREVVRRTHRGWPTMVTLALAFGVLEEGLLTQSLFNPNYTDDHLLDPGFVPLLGIGIPWTVFVLSLHTIWSISTPVAIVEESSLDRRTEPWLGRVGLWVTAALFVVGSVITFAISYGNGKHFIAKPGQLAVSAALVVVLVVVAFLLPRPGSAVPREATAPNPWLVFVIALATGGLFMGGILVDVVWLGVTFMLLALAIAGYLVGTWSRRSGWGRWHRFALACGALFTYSWHAFLMGSSKSTAELVVNLISYSLYALGALAIAWLAVRRIRRQPSTPDLELADASARG
ncbi:hypothetical protein GCM10023322_25930 [Rugosimonospora acidiphila]|uniref:DUF998 domain-containing protein n=1 Tax=Rugosimonospora acidiphila TaxID=556531 RepID=A0ABP9RQB2_9ACTN